MELPAGNSLRTFRNSYTQMLTHLRNVMTVFFTISKKCRFLDLLGFAGLGGVLHCPDLQNCSDFVIFMMIS